MNNNNEGLLNNIIEDEDEEEPINNVDEVMNNPLGDQDDANNNVVVHDGHVFDLNFQQVSNNPNAMITGPTVQPLAAPGHHNTIKYLSLLDKSNREHTAQSIYGDANRRRSRLPGSNELNLVDLRRNWVKEIVIAGGYSLFTPLNKARNAPFRQLDEVEYDAFIDKALDLILRESNRRSTMDKIDLLEAAQDANGITEIRDTRNEINGLTRHSTSLPSDNLHDYDDPIDPFHDAGTTNNNNSNNKWRKTLYFTFGLVSVLGLIGLGCIATSSHCTLDKKVCISRCKFTRVPDNKNNNISSIPSRIISSLINNEQGEGGTIGNSFIGITSSVVDLDGTEEISFHLDFSYVNDKLKDMSAWVGKHLTSIKEAWKDFSNATRHSLCNHVSLD